LLAVPNIAIDLSEIVSFILRGMLTIPNVM
jgi:hypothetical protein